MSRRWLFLALALFATPVKAADSTVAALTAAAALGGTELFYCVQGGADRKCTTAQIATFAWTSPTLTNATVTGSFTATGLVTNADLVNSATTVNGQTCTLGSTCTVAAAAGTLTGNTLAAGVTASSLTSVGTLVGGATGAGFTVALGTSTITGILGSANGGTGNGFFKVTGPTTSEKTFIFPDANATVTQTIASGSKALATSAISSAACSSAQTATATGTLTSDALFVAFSADPTATTGYIPATSGMLTIIYYPTADTVNFKVCNNTNSSITPGAVTLNWRVTR